MEVLHVFLNFLNFLYHYSKNPVTFNNIWYTKGWKAETENGILGSFG